MLSSILFGVIFISLTLVCFYATVQIIVEVFKHGYHKDMLVFAGLLFMTGVIGLAGFLQYIGL